MKLQKQPNNWSCLPTAFAMALDIDVEQLIKLIGHDGSEIWFPNQKEEHHKKRAFNPSEIMMTVLKMGRYVTPVVAQYEISPVENGEARQIITPQSEIIQIMNNHCGVLTGYIRGRRHAVAWDGNMIFDPNGSKYERTLFDMEIFWTVSP